MASLLRHRVHQPLAADADTRSSNDDGALAETDHPTNSSSFMNLPPEIHVLISKELIYPDALSLKHTSRHFYNLVDTGVRLKVAWLVQRRELHLDCPNDRKCSLRTDLEFCRGSVTYVSPFPSITYFTFFVNIPGSLLMQRRRRHFECESRPGLGCLVYNTPQCAHRRDWKKRWAYRRRQITSDVWWILLAAVPLLMAWLWMAELVRWVMK